MLVLIADDDPVTCQLVLAVVQAGGHRGIIARDAMQVMFMATNQKPDLIVLDLQMPAGTGVGALEKLKLSNRTATIPVLVLSGTRDEALVQRVLEMGAVGFLHKPADPEELAAAMERAAASGRDSTAS